MRSRSSEHEHFCGLFHHLLGPIETARRHQATATGTGALFSDGFPGVRLETESTRFAPWVVVGRCHRGVCSSRTYELWVSYQERQSGV